MFDLQPLEQRMFFSTTSLAAAADAYVRDGASAGVNNGSATALQVKNGPAGSRRTAYLTFDVSVVTDISAAKLRLFGGLNDDTQGAVAVDAYSVDAAWSENAINWNNQPSASSTLAAKTSVDSSISRWYELDVTTLVRAAKSAGATTVSVALRGEGVTSPFAAFSSKEAGANAPQLIVTTPDASAAAPAAPAVPTALAATRSDVGVSLAWQGSAVDTTGYRIERKSASGDFVEIASTSGATTYTDALAGMPGTTYTYRVRAEGASGTSDYSNTSAVTFPASTGVGATSGSVTTLAATADAFIRDKSYASTNYGATADLQIKNDVPGYIRQSLVKFDLSGLTGTSAKVMLRLYGRFLGSGSVTVGAYGVNDTGWTDAGVTWANKPAADAAPAATAAVAGVAGWYEFDVTAYVNAARAAGKSAVAFSLQVTQVTSAYTTFASREATGGNGPQLAVTLASNVNAPPPTSPPAEVAPAAPTNLTAVRSDAGVVLTWSNAAADAAGYAVERQLADGSYQNIATTTGPAATFTDVFSGTAGTTYNYRVRAYSAGGTSAYSGTATVSFPAASTGSAAGASTVIPASADAFVRDRSYAAINYGSTTDLQIKNDIPGYARQAFVKFDLTTVAGNVDSVVLRLYGKFLGSGSVTIGAYGVAGTSWTEIGLTAANKPAADSAAAATATVTSTEGWYEFDVTAYVRAALAAGKQAVAFELQAAQTTTEYTSFASRDAASGNGPQLTVSTSTVAPAAPAGASGAAAGTSVSLTWQASTWATSYNIYRVATGDTISGSALLSLTPYKTGVTATSFVDTGALAQTGYRYLITAVNSSGQSFGSDPILVTTGVAPTLQQAPTFSALSTPGLSVTIGNGQVQMPDGSIVAVKPTTLTFAAPEVRSGSLTDNVPQNYFSSLKPGVFWSQGLALKPTVDTLMLGGLYNGVIANSIVVKSANGSKTYVRDVDYKINEAYGEVINLNGRLGTPGVDKIQVTYKYVTQRLDLIQVAADGTLSVKKGTTSVVAPTLPSADAGRAALAGIYVYTMDGARDSNFEIRQSDIFPINPLPPAAPINPSAVAKTLQKLKDGQNINIAWFGDSITLGAEAGNWWSDRSKTYTGLTVAGLKKLYPSANISETAAYEGGVASTDPAAMTNFQNDVITPARNGTKIDLCVIALGMNDSGKPIETFKNQIVSYIQQAKAQGMEVLLVTPLQYNPFAIAVKTEWAPKSVIATALKEVAAEQGVACADVYTDWVNQASYGIPPYSQIHNWINHPGEAGMKIYANALLRFFK